MIATPSPAVNARRTARARDQVGRVKEVESDGSGMGDTLAWIVGGGILLYFGIMTGALGLLLIVIVGGWLLLRGAAVLTAADVRGRVARKCPYHKGHHRTVSPITGETIGSCPKCWMDEHADEGSETD